jgi:hypothetical protein
MLSPTRAYPSYVHTGPRARRSSSGATPMNGAHLSPQSKHALIPSLLPLDTDQVFPRIFRLTTVWHGNRSTSKRNVHLFIVDRGSTGVSSPDNTQLLSAFKCSIHCILLQTPTAKIIHVRNPPCKLILTFWRDKET